MAHLARGRSVGSGPDPRSIIVIERGGSAGGWRGAVGGDQAVACGQGALDPEISPRFGLHRKTVRRALTAEVPPRYAQLAAGSKLDLFKDWICEQLAGGSADPVAAAAGDGLRDRL